MTVVLERKIVAGFIAALAVLLLVTAAAWWNVSRFNSTQFWVQHTHDVLDRLEKVRGDLLTMQASSRGFVLTGSEELLKTFDGGSTDLTAAFDELQRLLADNPEQQARLTALVPVAARARNLMLERIEARRTRGLDATTDASAYIAGEKSVDQIRNGIRAMVTAERALLDDRLNRVKAFGRWSVFTMIGTSALATGFVLVAARIVRRDFARRRESARELKESYGRIEDLYNYAPCGYHSLDDTGTFAEINDTALRWLGYAREEVIGRMKFGDILAPDSREAFDDRFVFFKRHGSVSDIEYEWRRKDGSTFPVLLNATAIYDAGGKYIASRATVFDLTERKRVEAERDRFFDLSRDLLCIAATDGRFKRINPAWEHTLGNTREELMTTSFLELVHPEDFRRTREEVERLAAGAETIGFEIRFRCKDGSYRWLRWNARAAPAEALFYASAHDVTEQRAAAERIQLLNADLATRAAQLETANRELESFSYSVSHDLRAPLRHIDGFANLLTKHANDALDKEGRRYIAVISRSAKQMGSLIDDLLAFSRIGRVALRLEPVRQDLLVAEVIANGRFDSESRRITWEISPLPVVHGDASMLRQVWANLIENAVKYSGKVAAPRIQIGCTEHAESGEYVFFIRDNGIGFPMEYADKLFGVFQRLHNPADFEGTGIGLANVRRIVTRHGGRTWAEGRVGEGACFYFSLPLTDSSTGSSS